MTEELSMRDFAKYRKFINTYLEKEEGLAAISKRLQNAGVTPEMARELIREVALEYSRKAKKNALISIAAGAGGTIILIAFGTFAQDAGRYRIVAGAVLLSGIGLYFRSRKRLKYLGSLQ